LRLEDWPPLSTQPYGVQTDGTVVELYPIGEESQLLTVQGGGPPEPPTDVSLALGPPDQVSGGYQLDEGWYFLVNEGDPSQAEVFYTDGVTETVPTGGWQAYPVTVTVV
jgi:hypothetical protein